LNGDPGHPLMEETESWQDVLYNKTLSGELEGLSRRFKNTKCSTNDIEQTLKQLYINDGADWLGRGEVQDIILRATIAAYEQFLAEERRK